MTGPNFQILHPTDGSTDSTIAFAHALRLALQFRASLRIFHAEPGRVHQDGATLPPVRETLVHWGLLPEGSPMEAVADLGLHVRKVRMGRREPLQAIEEEAEGSGIDLLVMVTHPRTGFSWLLQGSVAEAVARRWPTLAIPVGAPGFVDGQGRVTLKRVLIPLDPKEDPQQQLEWSLRLAQHLRGTEIGELRLLQVGAAETEGLTIPAVEGWTWSRETRTGEVVPEILRDAREWKADLIVMGTRGHDSLGDSLWGSRTEQVLHGAPCPLLILPVHGP